MVNLRDYAETGDDTEFLNKRKSFWDQGKMILHILGDFPMVSRYAYSRLFPSPPRIQHIAIRNFMEMGPCRSNRIVLADARDKFGNRIPQVVHSPSDQDKYSMESLHRLFDDDLRKNQFGKLVGPQLTVKTQPWPVDYDASHHMGGTRMGRDPNNSVVNPDCRLHFSPNLYVAGSSVFPTSGNANPTYTIIALAIRLGKHLNNQCNNNE